MQSAAAVLSAYEGLTGNACGENPLLQSIYLKKFVNIESKWGIGEYSIKAF